MTTATRPDPEPRTLTDDGRAAFLDAALRVYNADGEDAANWQSWLPTFEPERFFGLSVGDRWVSTCGAFSRRLTVPGGAAVPVGAVTMVSVSPAYRRRGILRGMMEQQLADVHGRGEPLAILWAAEAPIYGRFGYASAAPRLYVSGGTRQAFRSDVELGDGWVEDAERRTYETEAPALCARLLPARVGAIDRGPQWWERDLTDGASSRKSASSLRYALHRDASGVVDGHALYRIHSGPEGGEVRITYLDAANLPARAALWRYLLDLDLVKRFSARVAPDDPLRHWVVDVRGIDARLGDGIWARVVDVAGALGARTYATPVDLVIGVHDRMLAHNEGSWRLVGGPDGAEATRTDATPDLELDVRELAEAYLGGTSLREIALAGRVLERTPGALADASRAFAADRAPFCPDHF